MAFEISPELSKTKIHVRFAEAVEKAYEALDALHNVHPELAERSSEDNSIERERLKVSEERLRAYIERIERDRHYWSALGTDREFPSPARSESDSL